MCGIIGVCSVQDDAADLAYAGLVSLQHRGQESWGLALAREDCLAGGRALGLAPWPPTGLAGRAAPLAIGHTRYSTTGAPQLENSQPLIAERGGRSVAIAHNGNITNAVKLSRELREAGYRFQSTSDSEVILALLASAGGDPADGVAEAFDRLEGAYSVVALFGDSLLAFRDPKGFRPLAIGTGNGVTVVSSESCVLDVLECGGQREIEPGELVVIAPGEEPRSFALAARARQQFCVFEYIYLARRDSRLGGARVETLRERLGELLAREAPAEADIVVPVPASGVPAARGYARASGLPLVEALVRNEYVGRTFIEPDPALRKLKLKIKFNVADGIEDRSVAVVDDSIVRGSTMRHVVALLRSRGARDVHVRIAAPPLVSSCYYGVDIADPGQLLAAKGTLGDVRRALDATTLEYLSLDGLGAALGAAARGGICKACLTGRYPTSVDGALDKLRLATANTDV